jgi:hypothetical protein
MSQEEVIARVLDLKSLKLPPRPKVVAIRHRPYIDSVGDQAVRVWVILEEGTPSDGPLWTELEPIERAIRDNLRKAGVEWFPYIHYATRSELTEAGVDA